MFRTVPLPIVRSFTLYIQQSYMSYRFCWQLASGIRMESCMYSVKLLMMDRGTVWNM